MTVLSSPCKGYLIHIPYSSKSFGSSIQFWRLLRKVWIHNYRTWRGELPDSMPHYSDRLFGLSVASDTLQNLQLTYPNQTFIQQTTACRFPSHYFCLTKTPSNSRTISDNKEIFTFFGAEINYLTTESVLSHINMMHSPLWGMLDIVVSFSNIDDFLLFKARIFFSLW